MLARVCWGCGWIEEAFVEQKRQWALNKRCVCQVCVSEFWGIRAGDIRVMVQVDKMPINRAGVDRAEVLL